jgi:hypothetical protein
LGSEMIRWVEVTGNALSLPAWSMPMIDNGVANLQSIWPPMRSVRAL